MGDFSIYHKMWLALRTLRPRLRKDMDALELQMSGVVVKPRVKKRKADQKDDNTPTPPPDEVL